MPDETAKLKLGKGRWIDIGDQEGLGFTVRAIDCGGARGTVIPVEMIEQLVEGPMKSKLLTWPESPPASFYVMHIAGSWFS